MSEKMIKGFMCDRCKKTSLSSGDFYKCIKCDKKICKSCGYEIRVKIDHNIPNGIPFLHTKIEYRICHDCLNFSKPTPSEVRTLLIPNRNGKLYRAGGEYEDKWIFVSEGE